MGISERKEREREQRRHEILDAAESLFFSRGYEKVSMDDIAALAELNKATIYNYYKNKETLFSAVVLRGIRLLNRMYQDCAETQVPGITKISLLGNAYYRWTRQYPDYLPLIHYFSLGQIRKDNPCAIEIMRAFDESRRYLLDAVKEGISDGTIREDMDPFMIAMFLTITSMSIISPTEDWKRIVEGEGVSYDEFIAEYFRFITPAISAGEKPHTVGFDNPSGSPFASLFLGAEPVTIEHPKRRHWKRQGSG